ncbi:MAG: DnaB-like helicase C-terminal domain-containing protein, partial [Paraclostridium sp.]
SALKMAIYFELVSRLSKKKDIHIKSDELLLEKDNQKLYSILLKYSDHMSKDNANADFKLFAVQRLDDKDTNFLQRKIKEQHSDYVLEIRKTMSHIDDSDLILIFYLIDIIYSNHISINNIISEINAFGISTFYDTMYTQLYAISKKIRRSMILSAKLTSSVKLSTNIASIVSNSNRFSFHDPISSFLESATTIQRAISGFEFDDQVNFNKYTIIGGKTSSGKTALLLSMMYNMSKLKNIKILFFSLEMTNEEIVDRLYSIASGVALSNISKGEINETEKFILSNLTRDIIEGKNNMCNVIIEAGTSSMSNIFSKILLEQSRLNRDERLVVFIDYIQKIATSSENDYDNTDKLKIISTISEKIHELVTDNNNISIICASQLNRQAESKKTNSLPQSSDLADCSSLEKDASAVLILHDYSSKSKSTSISIVKNRYGKIEKTYKLNIDPNTLLMTSIK